MREQEHPFQHRFLRFDMRWLSIHGVGIVGLGRAVRHSLGLTPFTPDFVVYVRPFVFLGIQNKEIQSHEVECIHCIHIELDCSWDSQAVGWSDIVSGECDVLEAGLERS